MSTCNEFDDISVTSEDCEKPLLSAIPIPPGGMVDIALNELGATIVDVDLVEEEEIPLLPAETT